MPASTFTLAVGHWCQVTAEPPQALERGVRDKVDCSKMDKPGTGLGEWKESALGRSSCEAVKGSTLQTWRYFLVFLVVVLFFQVPTSSMFSEETFLLLYQSGPGEVK